MDRRLRQQVAVRAACHGAHADASSSLAYSPGMPRAVHPGTPRRAARRGADGASESGSHHHAGTSRTHAAEETILVLQGGGALGAYQAGVYEVLERRGQTPHWVGGISIGAINAALIAGN